MNSLAPAYGPPCRCETADELARAKSSIIINGITGTIRAGILRQSIVASWTRCRLQKVPTDRLNPTFYSDYDRDSTLVAAANDVINTISDKFFGEPVSIVLTNADGVVLERRTGDLNLTRSLDRVLLAPGFSYAEQNVGTNGIGTALEMRGTAEVFGDEHYSERLAHLACAGTPIRHPISGKVLGVINLTCWRRDSSSSLGVTARMLAQHVQDCLLEHTGSRERALMRDYLSACWRSRDAVLALGDNVLLMNDHARQLFDSADQKALVAQATEALAAGSRHQLIIDLPSGFTVSVRCKPTENFRGGILLVKAQSSPGTENGRPSVALASPSLNIAVGSSPAWTKVVQSVDRQFQARQWTVLEGEPGVGKTTLARATHQSRTPSAHLRVLDAASYGPGWIDDVVTELNAGGGSLILTHIGELPEDGIDALLHVLETRRESTDPDVPWVAATLTRDDQHESSDLGRLMVCFPRTIKVPSLRHHAEDIEELVTHMLAQLAHGAELSCAPEAMRLLMRNHWPGNIGQLYQVLRKVVTKRRSGVIKQRDLPPECYATSRRQLTPMEALERDAIVNALLEADGSKDEAARLLGMSRATIFRKTRAYGIMVPRIGPGKSNGNGSVNDE